jgi:hypothetical protein
MKKEDPYNKDQRVFNHMETIITSTRTHTTQTLTITTTPGQPTHTAMVAEPPTTAEQPPTITSTNTTLKATTTTRAKTNLRITTVVEAHTTITGTKTAKEDRQTATHSQTLTIHNPPATITATAMINLTARAPTGRNTCQTTRTVSNNNPTKLPKTLTIPGAQVRILTTGTLIKTPTMTTLFGMPIRTMATTATIGLTINKPIKTPMAT